MRVLGALLGVVLGVGALAGMIWIARYAPWVERVQPNLPLGARPPAAAQEAPPPTAPHSADKNDVKVRPPLADKPPFPKAFTGVRVFEFGTMAVNEEQKHTFKIRNKGEGPLDLEVGPSTCKCTVGSLSKKRVEPGESVQVELTWRAKETSQNFAQSATIWTSDPDAPDIQFKVYGKVVEKYVVIPEKAWHAGHVTDVQEGSTTAQVASMLDSFNITKVESNSPNVKVTYVPLDAITLMSLHGKAGYQFTVKVDRGMPMGQFRVPVRIHTTLEGNKTIEIDVTGSRSGPMLFLPPVGKGLWIAEKSRLNLGRVLHDVGAKVKLPAIIYGIKDKFKVLKTNSDADFLKVSLEPNPEIAQGEQQGVYFVFELPPGSPAVTRVSPNSVHITLETNHPKLKEIAFEVEFICQ
ncbi:MAG TPA: DUF1573 domain-containing protein [Planctomycetaceae bacterium]|jgi:hypothetical protein|nr:DUF1573 domain-containing protein [Planctomycetaceae bacterium]